MLLWLSRSLCLKLSEAVDLAASVLALQCKRLLRKSWQLYAFCVGLFGCPLTQAGRRVGLMLLALVTREWEVWHLLCHLGGLHQRSLRIHHGQKATDRLSRSECSSEAKRDFLFWNIFTEDQEPVTDTCFCFVSLEKRKEVEQFTIHSKHSMNVSCLYYQMLSYK